MWKPHSNSLLVPVPRHNKAFRLNVTNTSWRNLTSQTSNALSTRALKQFIFRIIGMFFLLFGIFSIADNRLQSRTSRKTKPDIFMATRTPRLENTQLRELDTFTRLQKSVFYRTIVGNNLFRPLGWIPPPAPVNPIACSARSSPQTRLLPLPPPRTPHQGFHRSPALEVRRRTPSNHISETHDDNSKTS